MSDDGPVVESATAAAHIAGRYSASPPPSRGLWETIMADCLESLTSSVITDEDRRAVAHELAAYAIWYAAVLPQMGRAGQPQPRQTDAVHGPGRGHLRLVEDA